MRKCFLVGLFGLLLSGCAFNGTPSFDKSKVPESVVANTEKIWLGLPGLTADGSAARYNKDWMITVAHNYPIKPWAMLIHPKCDVAMYRDKGDNTVPIGEMKDKVFALGYPTSFLPLAVNEGDYVTEAVAEDGCTYGIIDATIISGMSGGGVYNSKGELTGVVVGVTNVTLPDGTYLPKMGMVLKISSVQSWIDTVIRTK